VSGSLRAALLLIALLGCGLAEAASGPMCDWTLRVELTPDVPDPRDPGFLSSLLSNEISYRLVFRGASDDSNILLELIGPGPAYRCRETIQTMRQDGRIAAIHVQRHEP
jgi:hypothetical protein